MVLLNGKVVITAAVASASLLGANLPPAITSGLFCDGCSTETLVTGVASSFERGRSKLSKKTPPMRFRWSLNVDSHDGVILVELNYFAKLAVWSKLNEPSNERNVRIGGVVLLAYRHCLHIVGLCEKFSTGNSGARSSWLQICRAPPTIGGKSSAH
jgi:hypothetical protein